MIPRKSAARSVRWPNCWRRLRQRRKKVLTWFSSSEGRQEVSEPPPDHSAISHRAVARENQICSSRFVVNILTQAKLGCGTHSSISLSFLKPSKLPPSSLLKA